MAAMRSLVVLFGLLVTTTAVAAPKRHALDDAAAIHRAVLDVAKVDLDKNSEGCTKRMTGAFAKVVLIGTFAYDRGCRELGYFADGVWTGDRKQAASALVLAGWADTKQRVALATRWTEEAIVDTPIGAKKVQLDASGGVVIEGWYTLPAGMTPERHEQRIRVTFTPAGAATLEVLEHKSTPMR
jgi:hypothetical protein